MNEVISNPISQKAGRAGRGLGFMGVVRSPTGLDTSSKPMLLWVEGHGCFETTAMSTCRPVASSIAGWLSL